MCSMGGRPSKILLLFPTDSPSTPPLPLQIRHAASGEPGKAMGDIGEMAKNAARVRRPGCRISDVGLSTRLWQWPVVAPACLAGRAV